MDTKPAPKRRRKTVKTVVVMAVLVIAAEVGSRFVQLTPGAWTSVETLWSDVGIPEVTKVLEPDPAQFWRVRPNLENVEVKGYLGTNYVSFRVSTDEHGFRTAPVPSSESMPAVLVLGDSTTFGIGVEGDQTYAARLDEALPDVRVLNGGLPGGTAYQARILVSQTPGKIACVVACFGTEAGDASWLGNLGDLEYARLEAARRQWANTCGLYFLLFHDLPTDWHRQHTPRRSRLAPDELDDQMLSLARWCRRRKVPPILVSWIIKGEKVHTAYQSYVGDFADAEGLPRLDVFEALKSHDTDALFIDEIHLKAEGHALVAEALAPLVREALGE